MEWKNLNITLHFSYDPEHHNGDRLAVWIAESIEKRWPMEFLDCKSSYNGSTVKQEEDQS